VGLAINNTLFNIHTYIQTNKQTYKTMTLPNITNKQKEILKLTFQFRYLNRIQIQKFLHHKDKKTINLWLKDLTLKDYLVRIYDPETFGKNTLPAVYYLSQNGIRFLKTQESYDKKSLLKFYREKNRSETFIADSQLLAGICIDLKTRSIDGISFDYVTQSDYKRPDSIFHFLSEFKTRLFFSKQEKNKKNFYLLDIFDTTLPKYRIRKRVKDYVAFLSNYEWIEYFKSTPRILFICQTKELLIATKRFTKKFLVDPDSKNIHISFALEEEVKKQGVTAEIWEEIE